MAVPNEPKLRGDGQAGADRAVAFRKLFSTHYRQVFAYAARRVSRSVAEDVVSETFLVAWRRYEEIPRDALPWLLKVAHFHILNAVRTNRRVTNLVEKLSDHEAGAQHFDELPLPEEADLPVLRALGSLAPADREVIMLDVWEELDHQRAALVLGISSVAFRVRLHRARRRLRDAFAAAAQNGEAEPPSYPIEERGQA